MGRGNSVIFGKISLLSEAETMDSLVKKLEDIIKKLGYPEAKKQALTEEEEKKLKELEEDLGKEEQSDKEESKPIFGRPRQ
jgi:uncharacterized membrane protein